MESPAFVRHRMLYQQHDPSGALDSVEIAPHGFEVTHMDALSHVYLDGSVYNGRRADEVVTAEGVSFGDVAALGNGVVGRGILLDVAAARGLSSLPPGESVTADDLDRAEQASGATTGPGDIAVVRTGIDLQNPSDRLSAQRRTGLDVSCVRWLRERDVGAYAGDCIEVLPSRHIEMPLHRLGLAGMGLVLIDAPLLEPLHEAALELDQRTFMFVCAPLPIKGATGSAVNPIAIL
jgi:kynurenine formamidase